MQLTQHPQYQLYVWDRELGQQVQEAVATWSANREPIVAEELSLCWTFERAQGFARALSLLAREYNRVLWERFPYCGECRGQCCVVDAVQVNVFDSLVLALLGQSLPALPAEIEATASDCIYRTGRGCAWPAVWKPVKCWAYYCLGRSGSEETRYWHRADASDGRYAAIADELAWVVFEFLPGSLRRYQEVWADPLDYYLADPFDFADALNDALFQVFVSPFDRCYPVIDK